MKLLFVVVLSVGFSVCAYSQEKAGKYKDLTIDSLEYVEYTDDVGKKKKALVAKAGQILIIDGDSIYTVSSDLQLRLLLEKQKGFAIINNGDSINAIIRDRIKSIVILKKKQ